MLPAIVLKLTPENNAQFTALERTRASNHILLECPIYNPIRNEYLNKYIMLTTVIDGGNLHEVLLNITSVIQINDIYNFICGAMRLLDLL